MRTLEPPTGHVFRRDGARRSTWYAKYRLPDGRQVQKRIGPAWTERGRPAADHFTKRTAEAWLREVLDEARRGTLPGLVQTGATFADAAAEFLRYVEHDRSIKPSTLTDYRSIVSAHLVPAFGAMRVEEVTPEKIERWRATVASADGSPLSNRTDLSARHTGQARGKPALFCIGSRHDRLNARPGGGRALPFRGNGSGWHAASRPRTARRAVQRVNVATCSAPRLRRRLIVAGNGCCRRAEWCCGSATTTCHRQDCSSLTQALHGKRDGSKIGGGDRPPS
jgi:Phage integrase, N-terminal SAM-like domain